VSTPTPPPPAPKADVQTLAYLLKEIENQLKEYKKGQRIVGYVLFFGGIALAIVEPTGGSIIAAMGFSKLFIW